MKPYWEHRGEFSHSDGLLLYNSRIVVPKSLQERTLRKIHDGHQGIERCRTRVKTAVWWFGISADINRVVMSCPECALHKTIRREPLISSQLPTYPWQQVGTDLFCFKGKEYLLVVDYFSRYPEVTQLTSQAIIKALKEIFSRHGIPEVVRSDNGPQYISDLFREFAKVYQVQHITSSPHYPQSNGQSERTIQIVKNMLTKAEDPYLALLIYRSTPFPWCGLSPAQLSMGRQLRSNLPMTKDHATKTEMGIPKDLSCSGDCI